MRTRQIAIPFLLFATACGAEGLQFGSSEQGVAPAGSNAVIVSNDIPTTVAPGERYDVTVRMRNTGAASPANDWDTSYRFYNLSGGFSFVDRRVPASAVPIAASTADEFDFNFVLTAPLTGSQTLTAQMLSDIPGQAGWFGEILTAPLTVSTDPNYLRKWDCSWVSDTIPAVMAPGQRVDVDITVRNEGTEDWPSGGVCLYTRDSPPNTWGGVYCPIIGTTAAGATQLNPGTGQTATFTFPITAPATEGTFTFRRQMLDLNSMVNGGVGFFDNVANCVDRSVVVSSGATLPYDADFVAGLSNIDDAEMGTWRPNEQRRVRVAMTNTGQNAWSNVPNQFLLYSTSTPAYLFKPVPFATVDAAVPSLSTNTFVFYARGPATPGVYDHSWRMGSSLASPPFFGDAVSFPVTVDAASPLQLDAAIDSVVIPPTVNRNTSNEFRITVRNTGFEPWDSSEFGLQSVGNPNYVWGFTFVPLPNGVTVAPGTTYEFVFNANAPSAPGTYDFNWQMRTTLGRFEFGAVSTNSVDVVANCGNGTTDAGEQCDDGNQTNGDGCSSVCQIESITYDLAQVDVADRTFYGVQSARDLSAVAIGDLNGDGTSDIAVGAYSTVTATVPNRVLAGEVWVHDGTTALTSNETPASQGALLHVLGARELDYLGGGADGSIKIGDVTGDTRPDLIISANFAACANGMGSCGRVYVIRGGTTTTFPSGTLDLAAPTPDVVAQIVSPTDGDGAIVLDTGDVTGDGIADIVIGSPGANGTRGRVVIVPGGASLTGIIESSVANVAVEVIGAAVDDQLGRTGVIGELNNAPNLDLLVSTPRHDPAGGGSTAGGAWAIFSPLSGSVDLGAGGASVTWLGAGVRDGLGNSIAIGDANADGNQDAIIGVAGTRFAGNVRFGTVDVWNGPFTAATTFDMSVAAVPDVAIQGREAGGNWGKCSGVADVNGDGSVDVIGVGFTSTGASGTVVQAGELGIVLGGTGLASQQITLGTTPIVVQGGADRGRMCMYNNGLAIGDIDNDGREDFCVASPQATVAASGLFNEGRVDCFLSPL